MRDNRSKRPASGQYGPAGYGRRPDSRDGGRSRQGSVPAQNRQPSRQGYDRLRNTPRSRVDYQNGRNGQNGYASRSEEARSRARLEALRRQRAEEERERRRQESLRRERQLREEKKKLEKKIKARRREERKKAGKLFLGRVAVGAVIFVILAVLTSILFAVFFTRSSGKSGGKVTYYFGGVKGRTVSYSSAVKNGKYYVCFNDVAKYLSMAETGNAKEMKFVIPGSEKTESEGEQFIAFTVGTRNVTVNSRPVTVDVDSVLYGEEIWVSSDFVAEYVDGINVEYGKSGNTVYVSRIEDEDNSTQGNVVYLPVSLKLKSTEPMDAPEFDDRPAAAPPVTFSTDLSAYEEYMNPTDNTYTVLVNASAPLSRDYVPDDLTDVRNTKDDRETQQIRLCAAKALEALFDEMTAAGFTDVSVTSGYRSYDDQETLFNSYVDQQMENDPELSREDAEAIVLTYSSRPGTSEHQTGLCVDMHNLDGWATVEFADTDAYRWLADNAWKFGFIERYPAAKTEITGVSYEPWHWRFVGRNAAYTIHEGGLCLEEYDGSDDPGTEQVPANGG